MKLGNKYFYFIMNSFIFTIRHYSSLIVTIRRYSRLFALFGHYSSLFATICTSRSLFVTICVYLHYSGYIASTAVFLLS